MATKMCFFTGSAGKGSVRSRETVETGKDGDHSMVGLADVVADYDGRTRELRALYVTPFLDENLLKEDYTGPGPMLVWT